MTTVQELPQHTNITIPKRPDMNLSSVYDRDFFMAFDLQHFKLERIGQNEPVSSVSGSDLGASRTIISPEDKENGPDLADELVGPETVPNGYSELPLDLQQNGQSNTNPPLEQMQETAVNDVDTQSENMDDSESDDSQDDETDIEPSDKEQKGGATFLENIQYYAHRYLVKPIQDKIYGPSNETINLTAEEELTSPNIPNKNIVITFPRRPTIQTLAQISAELKEEPASFFNFSNTGISYLTLENILKDLLIHFEMFNKEDVIITQIRPEFIYVVQDRYLLLDGESIAELDKDDTMQKSQISTANKAVLNLVFDLLDKKDRDVVVGLAEIRGTKIYKLLRRLELEDVFEWV